MPGLDKKAKLCYTSLEMPRKHTEWTEQQKAFIAWSSMSDGDRIMLGLPTHRVDFCKQLGIGWRSTYDWQKLPGFDDEVLKLTLRNYANKLPLIMEKLAFYGNLSSDSLDGYGREKTKPGVAIKAMESIMKALGVYSTNIVHKFELPNPIPALDKLAAGYQPEELEAPIEGEVKVLPAPSETKQLEETITALSGRLAQLEEKLKDK